MSLFNKIISFLAGFKLASILLILLLLLTFFGTLEQVDYGLYPTIQKYFSWESFIVFPELRINGKLVPLPLPGAYYVSSLLFVNMLLGGVIKIRKNWKTVFVTTAHIGVLFLILGEGITKGFEQRGNMALYEGESSNYAQAYHDHSIEVSELNENGLAQNVAVIPAKMLAKAKKAGKEGVKISHTELPFSFQVSHYMKNSRPKKAGPFSAGNTPHVDGYTLFQVETEKEDERNLNGCYVKASTGAEFLLFSGAFQPYILEYEGKKYSISLRKAIWKMPFDVTLNDFNAEFFPTGKPKKFESYITRIENGLSEKVKIYMNHPMRYLGFTFFQASWGPQEGGPDRKLYSVFEVVKNPADQWPLYSIIITSIGLIGHFGMMLGSYIMRQTRRKEAK